MWRFIFTRHSLACVAKTADECINAFSKNGSTMFIIVIIVEFDNGPGRPRDNLDRDHYHCCRVYPWSAGITNGLFIIGSAIDTTTTGNGGVVNVNGE